MRNKRSSSNFLCCSLHPQHSAWAYKFGRINSFGVEAGLEEFRHMLL